MFLTSISYAFVIYINSSFLQKFIDKDYIGLLYGIGSVITLITLSNISPVLRSFGHYKTMLGITLMESTAMGAASCLDALNSSQTMTEFKIFYLPLMAAISFLLFSLSAVLMRVSLDLYLEKYSKNEETGNARGGFLTTMNLAIGISPYLVGRILSDGDFWKVYFISLMIFAPIMLIVLLKMKEVPDVRYHDAPFFAGLKKIWKNKNIKNIFISGFMLELFYSWMTIYMPIYLYSVMKFTWAEIGLMFSIMLTPFIFLQLPLGKIADRYIGEKEILTSGYIITGLSTAYLAFITKPDFIVWTIALFVTRIGAAAIEIMNETYFFKKVSPEDTDILGFFRNASPIAYIIGPIVASVFIYYFNFNYLFLILGIAMLYGTRHSLAIKDTL